MAFNAGPLTVCSIMPGRLSELIACLSLLVIPLAAAASAVSAHTQQVGFDSIAQWAKINELACNCKISIQRTAK